MKTLINTFAILTLIVNISFAQLNTENLSYAPFISAGNSQQNMQSVMQNSEKDIVFIENLGQLRDSKGMKRPDVLFLTRSQGVDMYITSSGITYVFRKAEGDIKNRDNIEDVKISHYRLDMEFVGMNKNIKVKKELSVEQHFNYYTPEYPGGISPNAYKKITIENIYKGIDLVYYEKEGKMKYDFVVNAGADVKQLRMKYKGASSISLDRDGSVIVKTPMGEIREEKPYTYHHSKGMEIESRYEIKDNVVGFDIATYNKNEDIVIDPYRIWATYYGGNDYDYGYSIGIDNLGNLYVTGWTISTNFPVQTLSGAYNQSTSAGGEDAFILKFNSNGVRLWATYYGGGSHTPDRGYDICIDNTDNIYVTGCTRSTNFPTQTLTGAYNQTTLAGSNDAFILKFNSNGARLWATYYGGNNVDNGRGIHIDNSGNLYVTGETISSDFPTQTLMGAYNQTTSAGGGDAFILKFNNIGIRLWATYYGGSKHDLGHDICSDNQCNFYITGRTYSTNFPIKTLSGAYNQTTSGGGDDVFMLKFNSNGVRLWATYYGGNSTEWGNSICLDNLGNIYITGLTYSNNFPVHTLMGAYNQITYGGGIDAFILKFNINCARIWATYYGGGSWEIGESICTDSLNSVYVTGGTRSTNFPVQTLPGAYNQTTGGGGYCDAFILKFNSNSARIWASYYGGANHMDHGYSVCTDNLNYLYVTGYSISTDFPTKMLSGAYNQTTLGGISDAFILVFGGPPPSPILIYPTNGATLVELNPLLSWNSSAYAESYRVQVSASSNFTTTVYDISNIVITQFQIPNNGLNINTTYYWRVNATNAGGTSPYSSVFHFTTGVTNTSGNNENPKKFRLFNNYPNPFNPITNIKFDIPKASAVKLTIYSINGKEMAVLVNEKLNTGSYEVNWDASDYPSGTYLYRLTAGNFNDVKKMLLVK